MNICRFIVIPALMAVTAMPLFPAGEGLYEEGWNFGIGGYYKNLFLYQEREEFYSHVYSPPEKKKAASDLNRLRLSPELNFAESFTFHSDIDIEAVTTNYYGTDEFDAAWRTDDYNDFANLSCDITDNSRVYSKAEFQNIYAKMVAGSFTVTAGRHQVRFGSSRLWNPLDLMNPLSPLSVEDAGEQSGTDSLRVDWYPAESSELTLVAAPRRVNDRYGDAGIKSGNYIGRFKAGVKEIDAALLAGYTSKRKNFGADFAAEVYDGLLTGVFLCSLPESGDAYRQCGAGYEYSFSFGLYFLMEYFYNSLPVNDDEELQAALLDFAAEGLDEGNCYILSNRIITYNSHYVSMAAGYDFHPLLRGELFSIYDFQGRGVFLNALLEFNALENLDITAGLLTAFAGGAGSASDFEVYDRAPLFYASLQFYF